MTRPVCTTRRPRAAAVLVFVLGLTASACMTDSDDPAARTTTTEADTTTTETARKRDSDDPTDRGSALTPEEVDVAFGEILLEHPLVGEGADLFRPSGSAFEGGAVEYRPGNDGLVVSTNTDQNALALPVVGSVEVPSTGVAMTVGVLNTVNLGLTDAWGVTCHVSDDELYTITATQGLDSNDVVTVRILRLGAKGATVLAEEEAENPSSGQKQVGAACLPVGDGSVYIEAAYEGQAVAQVIDEDGLASGDVGLVYVTDSSNGRAIFKNLTVYGAAVAE